MARKPKITALKVLPESHHKVRDLTVECLGSIQSDDINALRETCKVCINPDCQHSNFGKSGFEERVTNWYDRLFSNPSTMRPDDPKYQEFHHKGFVEYKPEISIQSWDEPLTKLADLTEESTTPHLVNPFPNTPNIGDRYIVPHGDETIVPVGGRVRIR